ncbi:MAG: NADPH:quinone reductase [Rhodospirillaceae bacterium]|jgi:NADPH:quinone reductase|nr:NADPH:quinone reductase [Rhodospirillaceae bacterium]MBT5193367.1 NADPH:quinone reductase [Rhodospirillaceae bacterium]MBT5897237.1 NADPH:quinone reductase [Rhodospirillaceae bacterium]MBT6427365.1 NADPH:quinone reductase [Rhodospirillaceae bacterium]MBT7760154.1 NADPH:quinone reductase [Rhodospirillaceae bacterium]
MKAIRIHEFGDADVLQYEDVPDPVAGPGEVVIKVEAIGVNPVETYIRAGIHAIRPDLPFTPGSDAAGTVLSIGDGVSTHKPGDRVYAAGSVGENAWVDGYGERLLRRADHFLPLPDNVGFAQGAAIGIPYGTAYRALIQCCGARSGETMLVHGASGAVGTAALQIAAGLGLTTIGTAGSARGLELVAEHGAAHVLDHTQPGYLNAVADITGGDGPDIILEMLANVNLAEDMAIAAPFGRIGIIGSRGAVEINPREAMMKDLSIIAMALPNTPAEAMAEIHAALGRGLTDGSLNPVIGQELPLAEAIEAHHAVMRPGAYGKIVLVP